MRLQDERLSFQPESPSVLAKDQMAYYLEIQDLPPLSGPLARRFPLLTPLRPSLIRPSSRPNYGKRKKLNVRARAAFEVFACSFLFLF